MRSEIGTLQNRDVLVPLVAFLAASTRVDRVCLHKLCNQLVLDGNQVEWISPSGATTLGEYIKAAQSIVPAKELPIRDVRSPSGWRVVITELLTRAIDDVGLTTRIRLFNPAGKLSLAEDAGLRIINTAIVSLAGSELAGITSASLDGSSEVAEIWLLPAQGAPRQLVNANGVVDRFVAAATADSPPGVWIRHQTFDGEDPSTRGYRGEFWRWDIEKKTLERAVRPPQPS